MIAPFKYLASFLLSLSLLLSVHLTFSTSLEAAENINIETCMTEEGPAQWTGDCVNGLAQGEGIATYSDSDIQSIEGAMVDGVPTGKVTMRFSGGGYYQGEIRNGEPHGYGVWMEPWGEGYAGYWNDGHKHGEGVYITSDGKRISGVWRYGRLIGSWYSDPNTGCQIWWRAENDPVGQATWSGDCVDGKASGAGKIEWRSNDDDSKSSSEIGFDGKLEQGVIQGHGDWRKVSRYVNVTNITTYKGEWIYGERNGQGEQIHKTDSNDGHPFISINEKYIGAWKSDLYWGVGRYEKIQKGPMSSDYSITEEGEYVAGRLHGHGTRTQVQIFPDARRVTAIEEGEFIEGQLGGAGVSTSEAEFDGKRYYQRVEGDWGPNGKLHGIARYDDGSTFEGEFYGSIDPSPLRGQCEILDKNYSGPCETLSLRTSDFSGQTCLVPKGEAEPCLKVITSFEE